MPLRERITKLWVRTPLESMRTPRSKCTVGQAGCSEEAVVALDQVVLAEHAIEIETGLDHGASLVVALRREPSLDLTAHRLHRRSGDDALGGATDTEQDVGARIGPTRGDRAVDVAIGDQPDPRPARADLGDQVGVTGTVEDDHGEVAYLLALGLGDPAEVLCRPWR